MMPLLLDTGVLYALADADDDWHARARDFIEKNKEVLLAPATVLPEVTYLLKARLGAAAEQKFVDSIVARELVVQSMSDEDFSRTAALMKIYDDIGFVDASVVAMAERLRLRMIATTDRRHFAVIRPRHVKAFELVP